MDFSRLIMELAVKGLVVTIKGEPEDKNRIYISFIQDPLDPFVFDIMKKYKLHLINHHEAYWEFEIHLGANDGNQ